MNINFIDETSFAVSENARLSIDEYVFDPATESGQTDFSVLKGMFIYTSGLIGREDPDDVTIETPVGSIGIRGTIIAGDVDLGEITVVEGAIVLRDFSGNEVTLADQFESARFSTDGTGIEPMGQLAANDVAAKFSSVSNVSPTLFSSINDAAAETKDEAAEGENAEGAEAEGTGEGEANAETGAQDGKTDAPAAEAPKAQDAKDGKPAATEAKGENAAADKPAEVKGDKAPMLEGRAEQTPESRAFDNVMQKAAVEKAINTLNTGGNQATNTIAADKLGKLLAPAAQTNTTNSFDAPPPQTFTARTTTAGADVTAPHRNHNVNLAKLVKFSPDAIDTASAPIGFKWVMDLGNLFSDNNTPQQNLRYEITPNSATNLNNLKSAGINLLDDWVFDAATGNLHLDFNQSNLWNPNLPDFDDVIIEVRAFDPAGNRSDSVRFTLDSFTGNTANFINNILFIDGSTTTYKLAGDNNIYYLDNQTASNVEIGYSSGMGIDKQYFNLTDSTVYIGNNNAEIIIAEGSHNNSIYGSNNNEIFHVKNADNDIYAGDGTDTIKLFWSTNNVGTNGFNGTSKHTYDGGNNDQSWAEQYKYNPGTALGSTGLNGDTLEFHNNSGSPMILDFNQILADTTIKNIEHINLEGSSASTIILKLDQVIRITDDDNTLIISESTGGADTLQIAGITKADLDGTAGHDTVSINSQSYNVYTGTGSNGQTVTLFVDSDIAVTAA